MANNYRDRPYDQMHPRVAGEIASRRIGSPVVQGGLQALVQDDGASSTYQGLVNPVIRQDPRLRGSDTTGYVVKSPYLRDDYANQGLPEEIWMRPGLKTPEKTASHEANHILARKQALNINEAFDDLLGDFRIKEKKDGTQEKEYLGKIRSQFVQNASDAYPYLQEKYGLESGYFQPEMLKYQAKAGKMPLLLEEQLATLASIEDTQGVDLTKDPVLRETLFKDPNVRETYNALTGLRLTRTDSKDLPPATRLAEPEGPGMIDKLRKMIGFAEGGYVTNSGNSKLI